MGFRKILQCCCPCFRQKRSKYSRTISEPFSGPVGITRITPGGIRISSIEEDPDLIILPHEPVLPLKIPEKRKPAVCGITTAQVHFIPSWAVEEVTVQLILPKPLPVVLQTVKGTKSSLVRIDAGTSHISDPREEIDQSPNSNISNPAFNEVLPSCSGQQVVQEIPTSPSSSNLELEILTYCSDDDDLPTWNEDVSNSNTMLWSELPFRTCNNRAEINFRSHPSIVKRKFCPEHFLVKNAQVNRRKEGDGSKDRIVIPTVLKNF